jgi:small subunit ribosomal protein S22
MTTEQIEEELKGAINRASKLLQMPPIVKMRDEQNDILSKDAGISDFDSSPYVFTDISFGLRNSERSIVIRHTNGDLQNAPEQMRRRINQIYFPMVGRSTHVSRMFLPEYLNSALEQKKYEFILDRICVQLEPYDKMYHEIASQVYLHVNETKSFELLRSTRHFGPMAFFLVWHKLIDDLVLDMVKRDFMRNAVETVALMFKLNKIEEDVSIMQELEKYPDPVNALIKEKLGRITKSDDMHSEIDKVVGKSVEELSLDGVCLEYLQNYVKKHAIKKVQLELALQSYREMYNEKRQLAEGLRKAHGVN